MRRLLTLPIVIATLLVGPAGVAWACGGLVAPNGTVNLLRTTTLAAYHGGIEHYVTAFQFAGGGAEVGSIVPLPGVPTNVERGGDWTLQRLALEKPVDVVADAAFGEAARAFPAAAEVILETRIDALDITVLRGGALAVGRWAEEHGFQLPPDAPEVLEFYARRSPVFMAARFDAEAARERGQGLGDATPVHVTIPTENPWVPLRILALGRGASEPVQADVFLLTDRRPAMLPEPSPALGMTLELSAPASESLLADLRSDKGMGWLPADGMWLSYLNVDVPAGALDFDLAVDASGAGRPSPVAAGFSGPLPAPDPAAVPWAVTAVALLTGAGLLSVLAARRVRPA